MYYNTRGWSKYFTNTTDVNPCKAMSKVVLPSSNLRNLRLGGVCNFLEKAWLLKRRNQDLPPKSPS